MITLGFSGLYHDSAAALLEDGKVIAAASEERFTRIKNDASFPENAIRYCLEYKQIELKDIDTVVYYDNPVVSLDRFVKNAISCGERAGELIEFQYQDMFSKRLMVAHKMRKQFGRIGKESRLFGGRICPDDV